MFWRPSVNEEAKLPDGHGITPEAVLAAVDCAAEDLSASSAESNIIAEERPLTPTIDALRSKGITYPATALVFTTLLSLSTLSFLSYRLGLSRSLRILHDRERAAFRTALRRRASANTRSRSTENVYPKGITHVLNDLAALRSEHDSLAWEIRDKVGDGRVLVEDVKAQLTTIRQEIVQRAKEASSERSSESRQEQAQLTAQLEHLSSSEQVTALASEIAVLHDQVKTLHQGQTSTLDSIAQVQAAFASQHALLQEQGKELHAALHRGERSLLSEILGAFQGVAAVTKDEGRTVTRPEYTVASDGVVEEVSARVSPQELEREVECIHVEPEAQVAQPLRAAFRSATASSQGSEIQDKNAADKPESVLERRRRGRKPKASSGFEQNDASAPESDLPTSAEEQITANDRMLDENEPSQAKSMAYSIQTRHLYLSRTPRRPFPFSNQ